jgi:hypothetical protein
VSHPRQVVNGFTRRKPRHVRQTRSFSLAALGMLILSHIAGAQPLGINPSAAPSDLGNPSSINPAARASDVWNPSAINPAAAASQIPQPSGILGGAGRQAPGPRQITPLSRVPTLDGTPRSGITARQLEERRKRETEPGWSKRASVDTWQELRAHLATCWTVPAETVGSSVVLRFMISAVGELRGPPMITATNVVPKDMSSRYRETALAVLQKCLPVRPTPEFGAILHDTVLHLRLVNGSPFPSRNLGPWMTVFAHPNRGG